MEVMKMLLMSSYFRVSCTCRSYYIDFVTNGVIERPTLSYKQQLQTWLLDLKMDSKFIIDPYFKELQDLVERLAALGAPVENDFQVAYRRTYCGTA